MTKTDKKVEESTGLVREYVCFLEHLINSYEDDDAIIENLVDATVNTYEDDCECSDTFLLRHKREHGRELGNIYKIVDGTGIEYKED